MMASRNGLEALGRLLQKAAAARCAVLLHTHCHSVCSLPWLRCHLWPAGKQLLAAAPDLAGMAGGALLDAMRQVGICLQMQMRTVGIWLQLQMRTACMGCSG